MLKKLVHTALGICMVTLSVSHAETAIKIDAPWVRAAPPSVKVMAGYMNIINHSQKTITVTDINSPQFNKVEVHRSVMHDGMMHMEKIEPLNLDGHQELLLEPGGYHLMLIKPVHAIAKGDRVHFNFEFNNGDKLSLMAEVKDGEEEEEEEEEEMGHGGGHHH